MYSREDDISIFVTAPSVQVTPYQEQKETEQFHDAGLLELMAAAMPHIACDAVLVGEGVGLTEGDSVGLRDDGTFVGFRVGIELGDLVGDSVAGFRVGIEVGDLVGDLVTGFRVGAFVAKPPLMKAKVMNNDKRNLDILMLLTPCNFLIVQADTVTLA